MAAAEGLVERNRRFYCEAAPTLLSMMLVWPRMHDLGPPRLPDELWGSIAVDFVLPVCALNTATGFSQQESFSYDSESDGDSEIDE